MKTAAATQTIETAPENVAPAQGEPAERPEGVQDDVTPAEPAEAAEPSEAPEEGEEDAPPEEPEKKPKGHKRAGGWQRTIRRLEEEIAQLRAGQSSKPTEPAQPAKAKTPDELAAEFVRAQVQKQLAEERAQRQAEEAIVAFQARTQEVRKEHPDFDEVVSTLDVPADSAMGQAILTSPQSARIMYELGANPDELARISALPPVAAIREIGRLEAKLASGSAAPANKNPSPAPRKSAAPAPITPVASRGPSTVKAPEQMSYEEYSAWRDSQRKR